MKYLNLIAFILLFCSCHAQDQKLLLSKTLISDLSEYPIYKRLVNDVGEKNDWKEEYKYLNDIDIYGITYLSDGLKVRGLMALPKKEGKYPCVIFNRGGNRQFGSLLVAHGVTALGKIAKEGYVVIASQYRGNGGSEGQEEFGGKDINDVLNLIDVLEEINKADTDKIGMYGWSRGGMMTYIALTQTSKIKAAAVGGAPSDLTIIDRPEMESNVYAQLIPNYNQNKDIELKKRSAIHLINKFPTDVPILMVHGNADWRVKSMQSLKLAIEFEQRRIPYRLKIYEGGDHSILEHRNEVNQEVLNWFERFLKNGEQLPNMEFHGK